MSKLSPMKNTRAANKTVKSKNFTTHKDAKDYGHMNSRKTKQARLLEAWS